MNAGFFLALLTASAGAVGPSETLQTFRATAPLADGVAVTIEEAGWGTWPVDAVRRLVVEAKNGQNLYAALRSSGDNNSSTNLYRLGPSSFALISASDCMIVDTNPADIRACAMDEAVPGASSQICLAKEEQQGVLHQATEAGTPVVYLGRFDWMNGDNPDGVWGLGFRYLPADKAGESGCETARFEPGFRLEQDKRRAAARAAAITRPDGFKPVLDTRDVGPVIYSERFDGAFTAYMQTGPGHVFRGSAAQALVNARGVNVLKDVANCGACASDVAYLVEIAMPTSESYTVTLTVTAGGAVGVWRVTRRFDELPNWSHNETRTRTFIQPSDVLDAIRSDLSNFGLEACMAMLNEQCEIG